MSKRTFPSFSDSIKTERLDSHTYKANLNSAFCIGAVPNGGYTGSCMLSAASQHLASRQQTDTFTTHFEFLNRASPGLAIITVEDVKLGRQVSKLHLTLWQGEGLLTQAPWFTPSKSRRVMSAYATQINLREFGGITLPTGFQSTVADTAPPEPNFDALDKHGSDDNWEETKLPKEMVKIQASLTNYRYFLERNAKQQVPGVLDTYVCLASGELITQAIIPYIADSFPFSSHTYLISPELRELLNQPASPNHDDKASSERRTKANQTNKNRGDLWFPTVMMSLENKKAIPEEGVKWLHMRMTSKQIENGRFDIEVTLRDAEGDLVAVSHHVAMILSMSRNTAKRASKAAL